MDLCESMRGVIEAHAAQGAARKVTRVRLEIGRLAGVEIEALRFGFDVVMRGSVAEGATLEIIDQPGRAWCFDCGCAVEISARLDDCPRCGGAQLKATGGDAMRIKDIEVV